MIKKNLFLDLDGTLIDSKLDIAHSVNYALQQVNITPIPLQNIFDFIGHGLHSLIRNILTVSLNSCPEQLLQQCISLFTSHYSKHLLDSTNCYPFVQKVLHQLPHIQKVIITNKSKTPTLTILEKLSILKYFSLIITADDVSHKKPHPEPILKAIDILNLNPNDTIMVGDNYTDIESGCQAHVSTCFALYGLGITRNTKPNYTIDSFNQILQFF